MIANQKASVIKSGAKQDAFEQPGNATTGIVVDPFSPNTVNSFLILSTVFGVMWPDVNMSPLVIPMSRPLPISVCNGDLFTSAAKIINEFILLRCESKELLHSLQQKLDPAAASWMPCIALVIKVIEGPAKLV